MNEEFEGSYKGRTIMERLKLKRENLKLVALALMIFTLLVVDPLLAQAFSFDEFFDDIVEWFSGEGNEANIINEINVSTDTGETIINDEIQEGETKSKIYVKNIINGQEIDPIDIESEENKVKVESEITVEDGKAFVQREIEIDSEKTTENYEVDLGDSAENQETGILNETMAALQNFWTSFFESLKSFFQNLFNF